MSPNIPRALPEGFRGCGYELTYRYNYYSERYTTSSNEKGSSLYLLNSYYMNDLGLGKTFRLSVGELSVKLWVYNLFDEEYVSVLSGRCPAGISVCS